MQWPTLRFSRTQIDKAGKILAKPGDDIYEIFWAQDVLSNWRACHGYPVNTFQATLRNRLKTICPEAIVAQRLKRTPSILSKLQRFDGMRLSRMQDIVGLRAVVDTIDSVRVLERVYRDGSRGNFAHELVNSHDYIGNPKPTGYRGIHLVYKYKNERAPEYDGLQLELQIRTRLQHAWATAVETMGTFLGQALKSSQGEDKWLRFFEIAGCAFAYLEHCPLVPGFEKMSRIEVYKALAAAEDELSVLAKLDGFSSAIQTVSTDRCKGNYHLIVLDISTKTVEIKTYGLKRLDEAAGDYKEVEKRIADGEKLEAVLVSAGPIESLQRAYPNYFLDTKDFIKRVKRIIAISKTRLVRTRKAPGSGALILEDAP